MAKYVKDIFMENGWLSLAFSAKWQPANLLQNCTTSDRGNTKKH